MNERRRAAVLALTLAGAVFWAPPIEAGGAAGDEASILAALPAHTIALFTLDVRGALERAPRTALGRLLADEDVADFLEPAVSVLRQEERFSALSQTWRRVRESGALDLVAGRARLAIVGIGLPRGDGGMIFCDAEHPAPDASLPLDSGRPLQMQVEWVIAVPVTDGDRAQQFLLSLVGQRPGFEVEDVERDGVRFRTVRWPDLGEGASFSFAAAGSTLLLAINPERLTQIAARLLRPPDPSAPSLAADATFRAWRAASPESEVASLYYAPDPLSRAVPQITLVKIPGLRASGWGLALEGAEVTDRITVLLDGSENGLSSAFDVFRPVALEALGTRSAGAVARLSVSLEPAALATLLLGAIGPMGDDTDAPDWSDVLDGRAWLEAALPRSGLLPEIWAEAPLSDASAARALWDRLLGSCPPSFQVLDLAADQRALVAPPMGFFAPTYLLLDDVLLVASTPAALRRRLAGRAHGTVLAEEPSSSRDAVVALLDVDLPAAVEWGLAAAEPFLGVLLSRSALPLDPSLLPLPDTVASYLVPLRCALRRDERRIVLEGSSPCGGAVLGVALAGAALSVPQVQALVTGQGDDEGPPLGSVAPEIAGIDLDGRPFRLSDYRGTVLMLDFWGHW